jgi:pimeloyl-ACP methyl ester carboxylesterase
MKRKIAAVLSAVALGIAGLVVTAPAANAATCNNFTSSLGQCQNVQMNIGGTNYSVDWYLPNATASALMNLQNGFSRNCGHMRGTSKAIMEKGVMVFCVNTDMTGGNPGFADTLGNVLNARTIVPPAGKPLPQNYIVGGHSAGGHFASELGERLNALGYPNLKGAIMFDPVAAGDFTANLAAISAGDTRPVLSVAARPSLINLYNNSFGALESLPSTYVGIQLVWEKFNLGIFPVGGSCHIDSEGENTDAIGVIGAGCSANSTQTARLRDFGSNWAKDLATGTKTSAYWCTNENVISSCGSKVRDLVDRSLPLAATINAS